MPAAPQQSSPVASLEEDRNISVSIVLMWATGINFGIRIAPCPLDVVHMKALGSCCLQIVLDTRFPLQTANRTTTYTSTRRRWQCYTCFPAPLSCSAASHADGQHVPLARWDKAASGRYTEMTSTWASRLPPLVSHSCRARVRCCWRRGGSAICGTSTGLGAIPLLASFGRGAGGLHRRALVWFLGRELNPRVVSPGGTGSHGWLGCRGRSSGRAYAVMAARSSRICPHLHVAICSERWAWRQRPHVSHRRTLLRNNLGACGRIVGTVRRCGIVGTVRRCQYALARAHMSRLRLWLCRFFFCGRCKNTSFIRCRRNHRWSRTCSSGWCHSCLTCRRYSCWSAGDGGRSCIRLGWRCCCTYSSVSWTRVHNDWCQLSSFLNKGTQWLMSTVQLPEQGYTMIDVNCPVTWTKVHNDWCQLSNYLNKGERYTMTDVRFKEQEPS